eukprot:gene20710-22742_t
MPDWITAKYFDPNQERQRLLVHDYQQTELRNMRSMNDTKLVDCLEIPLKSFEDILGAVKYMLRNGFSLYLSKFFVPFVGDWPTQFYMRQLVYADTFYLPHQCHIIPFLGPLHISLNSRETVFLKFHPVFNELYSFLFGQKAILAKRPKAWRQSLLLEVLYGGWSLIRDEITSVFHNCKDVEGRTKATDTGEQIFLKAREIDACKHQLQDFKSWFVPQRSYSYCPAKIKNLKLKAAKFLIEKFEKIKNSSRKASKIPPAPRQRKTVTKWTLPNIFGDMMVTNQLLPLGYNDPSVAPQTAKKCDKPGCSLVSPLWRIFQCGHSFHMQCNLPAISECNTCKVHVIKQIKVMAKKANSAVKNKNHAADGEDDDDDVDEQIVDEQDYQDDSSEIGENTAQKIEEKEIVDMIANISMWSRPSPPLE